MNMLVCASVNASACTFVYAQLSPFIAFGWFYRDYKWSHSIVMHYECILLVSPCIMTGIVDIVPNFYKFDNNDCNKNICKCTAFEHQRWLKKKSRHCRRILLLFSPCCSFNFVYWFQHLWRSCNLFWWKHSREIVYKFMHFYFKHFYVVGFFCVEFFVFVVSERSLSLSLFLSFIAFRHLIITKSVNGNDAV